MIETTTRPARQTGDDLEAAFDVNLESFLRDWGPISWRDQVDSIGPAHEPRLAQLLHALSGIEDDAFYMQKKLRHSGAARLQAVKYFNSVWLVEEAEHARALAGLCEAFGGTGTVARDKHSTFQRDPRSIIAVPALNVARLYPRGITAAYMTLGVLVEYIAISTYKAIPRLYPDSAMADVLKQMSRQEGRHLRFYRSGATALLEGDQRAQAFVRFVVKHYWRPPGVDLYGLDDWQGFFSPITQDPVAVQTYLKMDDLLGRLPGMAGLTPMRDFMTRTQPPPDRPYAVTVPCPGPGATSGPNGTITLTDSPSHRPSGRARLQRASKLAPGNPTGTVGRVGAS